MMKVYNTLSRKIEELKPLKKGQFGIYSCGPTVYWNQHIGHMYAYTQWDVLVRFLRYSGFRVKWVMNITDVGHLTSDEDTGEDKMEKGARREGVSVWEIADKYITQFLKSMELLNIQKPDVLCRATEHIKEQIALAQLIEKNGFSYRTKTGLVFDTSKFPGYASFSRLDLEKQNAGARVEVDPEKKKPWDFLLWVTNQPEHIMLWDSPWGKGFPGWHLECTAMSTKYLGPQFDIHTGGKEHIPVHHTNEIAQAFGAFGRQTANYWLHNDWLKDKSGEKMSKSKGDFVTAQDLVAKNYNPLALRYLFLTSHYRKGLDFSWDALAGAQKALDRLYEVFQGLKTQEREVLSERNLGKIEEIQENFLEALNNDLNLPQALAVVWELIKSNIPAYDKHDLLLEWDQILGLNLAGANTDSGDVREEVSPEIKKMIAERERLRKEGKWMEADQLRKKILNLGFVVEDTPDGSQIKLKRK